MKRRESPVAAVKGRGWLVVACVALVGVLFLAAFPARTYVAQQRQREAVADEVQALEGENRELEERVGELQSDAEIERLAREHYGLVRPGEEVYAVLGPPAAPAPAPPPAAPRPSPKSWWEQALEVVAGVF